MLPPEDLKIKLDAFPADDLMIMFDMFWLDWLTLPISASSSITAES